MTMQRTFPTFSPRRALRAALAFTSVVAALAPAAAQPIFVTAPPSVQRIAQPVVRPLTPLVAPPGVGAAGEKEFTPRPPAAASTVTPSGFVLRHLTNTVQGFRLTGEIGQSEWPLYVTEAQARQKLVFKVGYLAAISVMPEASFLSVTINDKPVGRVNIIGTRGVRTASFDVPQGLLQPGFNSIRISAEHRHRVDCSLEATYELWTQIDPTQTGLLLPRADAAVTSLGEIAALPIDDQGAMPIRAITPARASMQAVERLIRAAQMISISGRFAQPVIEFGALASGDHGFNLVIGPYADIAPQIEGLPLGAITGPHVAVLPQTPARRVTIVATGRDDADVETALAQFRAVAVARGSVEGLRAAAAFPGVRLTGGERVRLRDLGLVSQEFSGRMFRAAFNIMLPPDFFAADYAKATLDMAGGYAAGLQRDAQILVSVNGRHAISLKLANPRGEVFKRNPMPLPLGAMRPGLNRVEIEAHLPAPSDKRCDPLAALTSEKRFLFLDATEIELPRIARIARMPDLAVTATGAFPYDGSSQRPTLALPSPTRDSVGAAATLATQLGIAAGRPIDFRLSLSTPEPGDGPAIVIAPASALDPALMESVGLKPGDISKAWREKMERPTAAAPDTLPRYEAMARHRLVLQRNFPAACHMPTPEGGFRKAERMAVALTDRSSVASTDRGPTRDLFEEWDANLRGKPGVIDRAREVAQSGADWVAARLDRARQWSGRPEPASARADVSEKSSLVIAQSLLGGGAGDVRTLVTAPDAATLTQAIACLVDPRVWRQVSGRVAVLNMADAQVAEEPAADATLIQTQPISIQNTRLIMAGWFSLNTRFYVGLALLMALLLGAATASFVRNVGRKNT